MKPRLHSLARVALPLAVAIAALLAAPMVHATSDSWNVDAAGNWNANGSWLSGTQAPGSITIDNSDIATFSKSLTGARTVTVDTDRYIGGISFGNTSTNGFTLSGGTLHLNSGGVIQTLAGNGAHTDTISSALVISGASGATATITAGATSATNLLSIATLTGAATAGNTTTVTLNVSNTGSNVIINLIGDGVAGGKLALVKDGVGAWTIKGTNTYTGGLSILNGTVNVSAATGALSTGSVILGNTTGSAAATLKFASGTNFTYSNPIVLATGTTGTLTISAAPGYSDILVHSGGVTGTNNVTFQTVDGGTTSSSTESGLVNNSGSITFTNNYTYGAWNLSGGVGSNVTQIIENSTGLGGTISGSLTVNSSGTTLTTTGSKVLTLSGGVTGTGNLILTNQSATNPGITLSGGSNNIGTITNSGSGSGGATIGGVIGAAVTGVMQSSTSSSLTLTGANTFSSNTKVTAGTLIIGNLLALQNSAIDTSGAGAITVTGYTTPTFGGLIGSANLASVITTGYSAVSGITLNPGANITNSYSGVIANGAANMSITKSGAGTQVLSGTNTYTGTTTVNAGLLQINGNQTSATGAVNVTTGTLGGMGTIGGAVTVSSTGGINLANSTVGILTLKSALAITGAAGANKLTFDLANAGSTTDQIAVTGAFSMTTSGAGVIALNQLGGAANRLTAGTYNLLTAGSGFTAGGGNFQLATTKAFGETFSLANTTTTALKLTTTQVSGAVQINTTLAGTNASWVTAANFTQSGGGNALPDHQSNVIINSNVGTSPLNGSTDINSLTFGSSATTGVTISAGTATTGTPASMLVIEATNANSNTVGNGITLNNATGTHMISANVGLASSQTWTIANAAAQLTAAGVISDFGGGYGITLAGPGTFNLNAANTFTGGVTINSNALVKLGNAAALGGNAGNVSVASGAALDLNGLTIANANALTLNGTGISNGGALTNSGGAGTYAGLVTLGSNSTIGGSGAINLSNPGTIYGTSTGYNLTLQAAGGGTITSSINGGTSSASGSGAVTVSGGGTWNLNGVNTFSGGLNILNGQVNIGSINPATLGSGTITLGDSAGSNNATLSNNMVAGSSISFSNPITVAAGSSGALTILANNNSLTLSGAIALNNNLTVSSSNLSKVVTFNNLVTQGVGNPLTITMTNGSGINSWVIFSGGVAVTNNGLTFATTAGGGTLTVGTGNITGSGPLTFNANGAANISVSAANINHVGSITNSGTNTGTTTISGNIGSNVTSVTQNSATSTLTLSGTNTFTGGLIVKAGKVSNTGGAASSLGANNSSTHITLGDTGGSSGAVVFSSQQGGTILNNPIDVVSTNAAQTVTLDNGVSANTTYAGLITLNSHDLYTSTAGSYIYITGGVTGTGNLFLNTNNSNTVFTISGTPLTNIGNITINTQNPTQGGLTISTLVNNTGTLTNISAGNMPVTITGAIGSNVTGLIQNSPTSVMALTNAQAFGGSVAVNAGTLTIGFTLNTGNNTATTLTLGGGTLLETGKITSPSGQTFTGGTSLNLGASSVTAISEYSTMYIDLGAITRNTGSTLLLINPDLTFQPLSASHGILTSSGGNSSVTTFLDNGVAYATSGLSDWAAKDASGTWVVTLTGATDNTTSAMIGNAQIASGIDTTLAAGSSITTLKDNLSEARTITASGQTITTGGILIGNGVTAGGLTITGGTLRSAATIANKDLTIIQNGAGYLTINAAIANAAAGTTGLTKSGSGYVNLAGTNTYSGPTQVNGGNLVFQNISAKAAGTVTANAVSGIALGIGGSGYTITDFNNLRADTPSGNTLGFSLNPASSVGIDTTASGNMTYATALTGSHGFGKFGTNTLTLTAANTYTGVTTIGAGTLQIGNGGTLPGTAITNNSVLQYSSTAAQTLSSLISGTGALIKDTSTTSTLILSNTLNSFTGGLYINAGTVSDGGVVGSLGALDNIIYLGDSTPGNSNTATYQTELNATGLDNPIIVQAGSSGTLTIKQKDNINSNGTIPGNITLHNNLLVQDNSGYPKGLMLSGAISGTGNITIGSTSGAAFVTLSNLVNNVGTITNTSASTGATTFSGTIGGNVQGLIQNATAPLVVNRPNGNFRGDTTVITGILSLQDESALINSVLNINGGALTIGGGGASTITALSLGGLAGTGNIDLNNNATTPAAVALTIGNDNIPYGGNTLNPSYAGILSGPGSLDKIGGNTQTLTGANSYTGGTIVTAGTLMVNNTTGSGTGSGAVTVDWNLGGSGKISGPVTVDYNGMLMPGAPIGTLATGALTMVSTSGIAYDNNTSLANSVGLDLIKVNGSLTFQGDVALTLTDLASVPVAFTKGETFTLVCYTGNLQGGGSFTNGWYGPTIPNGTTFTAGLTTWRITYDATTGGLNFPGNYGASTRFINITTTVNNDVYTQWATDAGLSGTDALASADPDHDGLNNLLEFVVGGQPNPARANANSVGLLPSVAQSAGNVVFTFRRTALALTQPGLTITPEYGTTLGAWTAAQNGVNGVTVVVTPNGFSPGVDMVVVTIPQALAGNGKLFARLHVTSTP